MATPSTIPTPSGVTSPELKLKPVKYVHGTKTFTRIMMNTGSTSFVIPPSSTQETIFEIPVKALYLSDSFISGSLLPIAAGAGNVNWNSAGQFFVSEIHLQTRGGIPLCDLYYLDRYRGLSRSWNVPLDKFMTSSESRFRPSRGAGAATTATSRPDGTANDVPYTESLYLEGGTANAATPTPRFTIPLGDLNDTIFALRKALLLPEILVLRVIWGPLNRFSWFSTSAADCTAGVTVPVTTGNGWQVQNLVLNLAIETDPVIVKELMELQMRPGGYQMAFPHVYCNTQNPTGASTTFSITAKATPDMGFLLKRIVYGIFNNTDSLNTCQDHSNVAGAKISSYNTQLDSVPMQQYLVQCGSGTTTFDDWKLNERLCKGTAIQSTNVYQYNWFHCDDFSDLSVERLKELGVPKESVVSGIPILNPSGSERIWTITATCANAQYKHYVFFVTYKTMVITPSAVMVVNVPPAE